ncbi:Mor transcription activator family protein [Rhodanobacter ginsengisoli]|uniref:Mor transcription activator family protein n=1 Tax=Rhodanobacter ginsengisoli TaxID=418646 RepID=A0ABW0QKE0_9GAMM
MSDMFEHAPTDAELAGIESPSERWPSTLAELVDVLRATFQRRGRDEAAAIAEAQQAVLAIGTYLGGRQIYLPSGESLQTALRDRRIYLEYKGVNKGELARRYDVSERRIEQIAAEQRAIHIRRIQPDLFAQADRGTA